MINNVIKIITFVLMTNLLLSLSFAGLTVTFQNEDDKREFIRAYANAKVAYEILKHQAKRCSCGEESYGPAIDNFEAFQEKIARLSDMELREQIFQETLRKMTDAQKLDITIVNCWRAMKYIFDLSLQYPNIFEKTEL